MTEDRGDSSFSPSPRDNGAGQSAAENGAERNKAATAVSDAEAAGGQSPSSGKGTMRNKRVQMAKVPFPALEMPLGYDEICRILPHRYPFLLVDRITVLEPGVRCVGVKSVTANEEFFQGHFPGHPVMPGVLMLEAMAQVAGVLTLVSRNTPGALSYFAEIEKARFRKRVQPGDQLIAEATLEVLRGALCKVHVCGRVDDQVVVEADYTFMTAENAIASAIIQNSPGSTLSADATPAGVNGPIAAGPFNGKALISQAASSSAALSAAAGTTAPVSPASPQAGVAAFFEAPRGGVEHTYIHPTAMVDPAAELAEGVWIGPYCIVEGGTKIGSGTILEANIMVKRGTTIGKRCRICPNAILGHDPQDIKFRGEATYLRIGDDNILREMVTIHRATGEGESTVIGNNNLFMAYVHIGHNCVIGNNNMVSNSTGISGHVTVEDRVTIGGFVGIHQFVHIGKMAMVGGLSKVVQDVPPFCTCDGRPAKIHGLNIRGLRRNGVSQEERTQVGAAVKLLYRSGLNTSQAIERIRAEIPSSETLDYLVNFLEQVRKGWAGRQDETPHL